MSPMSLIHGQKKRARRPIGSESRILVFRSFASIRRTEALPDLLSLVRIEDGCFSQNAAVLTLKIAQPVVPIRGPTL